MQNLHIGTLPSQSYKLDRRAGAKGLWVAKTPISPRDEQLLRGVGGGRLGLNVVIRIVAKVRDAVGADETPRARRSRH